MGIQQYYFEVYIYIYIYGYYCSLCRNADLSGPFVCLMFDEKTRRIVDSGISGSRLLRHVLFP